MRGVLRSLSLLNADASNIGWVWLGGGRAASEEAQ